MSPCIISHVIYGSHTLKSENRRFNYMSPMFPEAVIGQLPRMVPDSAAMKVLVVEPRFSNIRIGQYGIVQAWRVG